MFFLRLIQWLFGYVRFYADGGFPEKFLNLSAGSGIILWNIKRRDTGIAASTLAKNYKKLRDPALKSGVVLQVITLQGLPFKLRRFRKRQGLITGILLFIATLWFFSSFIWTVNISGNKYVSTDEITQVLGNLGMSPGVFPILIDTRKIEQEALLKLPDLSGIAININGSAANVKVRERDYAPDLLPQGVPCNLKASFDGQVIKLETYLGKPMIRTGDTIKKGEILISGVLVDRDGATTFIHASGKAIARTKHDLEVTVKYSQQVPAKTGTVYKKSTLGIFNFNIPLFFNKPTGNFNRTVYTNALRIFGTQLPFSITTQVFTEVKTKEIIYTEAEAHDLAQTQLTDKAKTELSSANILNTVNEFKTDDSGYTLIGHYFCEEDITYEDTIHIS